MLTALAYFGCESNSFSTDSEVKKDPITANTRIIDSSDNHFLDDYPSEFNTEEVISFDSHVLAMNSISNLDILVPETNESFLNPVLFTDINNPLIFLLFSKIKDLSRETCKYHLLVVGDGMQPTARILEKVTKDSIVYTAISENLICRKMAMYQYITFLIETCNMNLSEQATILTKKLKYNIYSCDDLSSKVFYGEWTRHSN